MAQVIAFRNVVIHEYFGVDLELVWGIVTGHLAAVLLFRENGQPRGSFCSYGCFTHNRTIWLEESLSDTCKDSGLPAGRAPGSLICT